MADCSSLTKVYCWEIFQSLIFVNDFKILGVFEEFCIKCLGDIAKDYASQFLNFLKIFALKEVIMFGNNCIDLLFIIHCLFKRLV